jgi:hypothetical protein
MECEYYNANERRKVNGLNVFECSLVCEKSQLIYDNTGEEIYVCTDHSHMRARLDQSRQIPLEKGLPTVIQEML